MIAAQPRTRAPSPTRAWFTRSGWLIVLLMAAVLRFVALDASSLWSDEGNTYALIQRTFGAIARDAAADIHPPGYYWLLKLWSMAFGSSAAAMRAFSALLGMLLVAVVYAIGRRVDRLVMRPGGVGLTAALLAALNPFQLYYSQEARMYMLLALAGALLFWALLAWLAREAADRSVTGPMVGFVLAGALGLWTHYSFPILLFGAGLAYLWHWCARLPAQRHPTRALTRYVLANFAILIIFAPWLPTAITRVLAWPKGGHAVLWGDGVRLTLQTLLFGPLRDLPEPLWPWLVVGALLPVLGIVALVAAKVTAMPAGVDNYAIDGTSISPAGDSPRTPRRVLASRIGVTLALWLLAPVGLMFALGLFSDAFLKFLLVASPAWALLCACAPLLLPWPRGGSTVVGLASLALAASVLPAYYTSSTVRDNYAGVAAYVAAAGDASTDVVILDAPGQGDVWSYYAPDVPVLALPQSRPPDAAQTIAQLEDVLQDRRRVFALFWATDEADPDRLVEGWLDQHAFRGLESWQGNLRFVVYSLPNRMACEEFAPPVPFGDAIDLQAQCQPTFPPRVQAGEVALLGLQWQSSQPLASNYKVTVQLLDARNQVIAQHDAEPAGGSRPTSTWEPNILVLDNHGLTIPPGTPPGTYRLIVAMYEQENFARLATPTGDAFELGAVEVVRAEKDLPVALVDMGQRTAKQLGPVQLVGYDAYKKGFSFAPEAPLQPGDVAHFTFYWQAPDPLPADWPADLAFTLTMGAQSITAPLAGGAYPTGAWQAGEFVRGEFDLPYDGSGDVPTLEVAGQRHTLQRLPR